MPRTPEQRAAANRANARNSTGPKSAEGKRRSRRNAFKHGLCAVLPMPDEDPAVVDARECAWNDYYQPGSPAAQHLVNQCVRATVMADRCQKHLDTVVAQQVREAIQRWDNARQDEVLNLLARMATEPATSVLALRRTSDGCRALAERWEQLGEALQTSGAWGPTDARLAVNLQGFSALGPDLKTCAPAWLTLVYGAITRPGDSTRVVDWYLREDRMPDAYTRDESGIALPDREGARELLLEMVEREIGILRDEAERLEREIDGLARDAAVGLAYLPTDPNVARLSLRYHAESRLAFHRSFDALVKTLKQDDAHADETQTAETLPEDEGLPTGPEPAQITEAAPSACEPSLDPVPERSHFENDSPQAREEVVSEGGDEASQDADETVCCDVDRGDGADAGERPTIAGDDRRASRARSSRRRRSRSRVGSVAREEGYWNGQDPSSELDPDVPGPG